jgi:hypothetical protein
MTSAQYLLVGKSLLLVLFLLTLACAPAAKTPIASDKAGPAPTNLRTESFHQRANLYWDTNRDRSDAIMGFNIYVSNQPVLDTPNEAKLRAELKPYTDSPYPGATSGNVATESFGLERLTNGESYFVFVTTLYPGGVESAPSNQVEVIARSSGTVILAPSFSGPKSGFSFKNLEYVYSNDLANDLYLTEINGLPHLASPHRIDNVLRETRFFRLSRRGSLEEATITELKIQPDDVLPIYLGEIFVLQDADNCYALVHLDTLDRETGELTLSFIYQAKPNTLRF